jgi:hypothetical protein
LNRSGLHVQAHHHLLGAAQTRAAEGAAQLLQAVRDEQSAYNETNEEFPCSIDHAAKATRDRRVATGAFAFFVFAAPSPIRWQDPENQAEFWCDISVKAVTRLCGSADG